MMSVQISNIAKPNTLKGMYLFNTHLFESEGIETGSNLMLFGTNGVGKTTTLSLLAFFPTGYEKLFKQEKGQSRSFYDYFFAKNNSFIVYEYEKEEHNVLVAVCAKEGADKLEFHFIALKKDSYSVPDIFNKSTREAVLNKIDGLAISSIVVPSKEYLEVLYGASRKENKIFMFSHVRNYTTFAKLNYASFQNIAIDSAAVKRIILEYAYAKDDMSKDGVGLEKHENAIEAFQSDHSAIMEWKKNYHTIDLLRSSLLNLETYEKRKINTLLKIQREWKWYIELIHETNVSIQDKITERTLYVDKEYPALKKSLTHTREEAREKVTELKQSIVTMESNMNEYTENTELMRMVKELPKYSEYVSELESSRKILSTLQEKNMSASEKHEVKLNELKKHLDATVAANNLFLSEEKEVFQTKKIEENTRVKEAEDKARRDFSRIDSLKSDLHASLSAYNNHTLELEKIKLRKFTEDERCISIERRLSDENTALHNLKTKYIALESKEKELSRDEDIFLESQRKSKEENRLSTDKALQEVKDEIEKLDALSTSSGTLYSQIMESGLSVKKYTSILKMEVLESSDFTINRDDSISGMQVFDFELSKDTELVEAGESIYRKKTILEGKRDDIKAHSKKILKDLETAHAKYYAGYRDLWSSLKNERAALVSSESEHTETIDRIKEERVKAEENWNTQRKTLLDSIGDKISSCDATSSELRAEIKILEDEFTSILNKIKSNPYNEKADVKKAQDECLAENRKAKEEYEKNKNAEDELYQQTLKDSGVDSDEVAKYTELVEKLDKTIKDINAWEMKIREYETFIEIQWVKHEGLIIELSQKTADFNKLDKKIDDELKALSQKIIDYDNALQTFRSKKSILEAKNKALLTQVEGYASELEQLLPLADKTEEEKQETDFNSEADNLLASLSIAHKVLYDEKAVIDRNVTNNWGTFIGKGALLFPGGNIENARKIVAADDVDEMGVFTDKTYQSINLSINAIASHYSILQEGYSAVKSAISRINKDLEDIGSTTLIESIRLRAKDKDNGVDSAMQGLAEYWKLHSDNMQQNLFSTDNSSNHKEVILEKLKDFVDKLKKLSSKEKSISVGGLFDLQGKIIEKGNESEWEDGAFGKGSEGTRILIKVAITASLLSMALSGSRDKQTPLLMIDEIGKLHNDNVQRVLEYVNKKGSYLVAVQPNNSMAKFFDRAYILEEKSKTQSVITEYLRRKIPLKMKGARNETITEDSQSAH